MRILHEHLPRQSAAQRLRRQLPNKPHAFRKHHAHPQMQVRLDMAMKRPNPRIIRHEPQRRPSKREDHRRVPKRRVLHIELRRLSLSKLPLSIPKHPEIMPVQMPRVNLTHIRLQRIRILQYHINRRVESQHVNPISIRRVLILRRPHHVVVLPEPVGWALGVEGVGEAVFDRA